VLILLPPSEGKAEGGRGAPLDLSALSFPALTPTRRRLVEAVERLAQREPDRLRTALGLSERQQALVEADARLTTARTMPVMARYTGVLYDALGYATLQGGARRRANASLVVASALFGLLRPADRIPSYRLSGGTTVPGLGGLAPLWRRALEPELAGADRLVVDLRSGAYAALARVPGAVDVRVLREEAGRRTVVSHDNKYTKGHLARALCEHGARTVAEVAELGRAVADDVEVDGRRVDLVLRGLASARQTVDG
jgi:cytoplasmic iron level regulating protein YaaA (DUF328/UPF0246 family)